MNDRKYYGYKDVIKWAKGEIKNKPYKDVWNNKLFKTTSNRKVKHGKGKVDE